MRKQFVAPKELDQVRNRISSAFACLCFFLLSSMQVIAQQITGVPVGTQAQPHTLQTAGAPGSPNATTTIDGRYLPPPPQPFQGQIELNAVDSKPAWRVAERLISEQAL
jgi:hypothetical protein